MERPKRRQLGRTWLQAADGEDHEQGGDGEDGDGREAEEEEMVQAWRGR
jgi:hypothetical protein